MHISYNYKQSLNLRLLLLFFTLVYIQYFIRWIRNPISIKESFQTITGRCKRILNLQIGDRLQMWKCSILHSVRKRLYAVIFKHLLFYICMWRKAVKTFFISQNCLYLPGHWSELDAINFIFLFLFLLQIFSWYCSNCWRRNIMHERNIKDLITSKRQIL